MNELVEFKNQVVSLSDDDDDLIDKYFELTINFDIKLITNKLTQKQKLRFLGKCGLTSEEIQFYDRFDNSHYQNNINYLIDLAEYDAIKARIFKFLFSILRTQPVNYLLKFHD